MDRFYHSPYRSWCQQAISKPLTEEGCKAELDPVRELGRRALGARGLNCPLAQAPRPRLAPHAHRHPDLPCKRSRDCAT